MPILIEARELFEITKNIKIKKIFSLILKEYYILFYSNTNSQPAPQASLAFFKASSTDPPANKVS